MRKFHAPVQALSYVDDSSLDDAISLHTTSDDYEKDIPDIDEPPPCAGGEHLGSRHRSTHTRMPYQSRHLQLSHQSLPLESDRNQVSECVELSRHILILA